MPETTHTPGPWHRNGFAVESKDRYIGHVDCDEANDHTDNEANAHLIAAAPELLAALQATLPLLRRLGDFIGNGEIDPHSPDSLGNRCDVIGAALDAIAKAEGRR